MQNEIKRHRHRVQQQQNHRNGVFDYNNTTISSQQLIDILGTYQLWPSAWLGVVYSS